MIGELEQQIDVERQRSDQLELELQEVREAQEYRIKEAACRSLHLLETVQSIATEQMELLRQELDQTKQEL